MANFSAWISLFLVALSCVLYVSQGKFGSDRVKLEVYIESGCPVSQAFVLGELTTILYTPDIMAVTDFKYVPFGNSFFNGTTKLFECYDEVECQTDSAQLCGMLLRHGKANMNMQVIMTGENSLSTWPFIACMEKNEGKSHSSHSSLNHLNPSPLLLGLYTSAESCWESTMSNLAPRTTWQDVYNCQTVGYVPVMTAADVSTPQDLTTVPWVLVNNVRYNTSDANLLETICKAYTGTPIPNSCTTVSLKH